MTKKEKKQKAQDLIMQQLSIIGYGDNFQQYLQEVGDEGEQILFEQMCRVAKLFGYEKAWFS